MVIVRTKCYENTLTKPKNFRSSAEINQYSNWYGRDLFALWVYFRENLLSTGELGLTSPLISNPREKIREIENKNKNPGIFSEIWK